MGFEWARPTTFDEPTFEVGDHVLYYAVDHSPSYLWNSATWENSVAIVPFLRTGARGRGVVGRRRDDQPSHRVRDGLVVDPAILAFQGRDLEPPYAITAGTSLSA